VAYLPDEAQEVIGKVHLSTAPARRLLEQEGLHFEGYVDIFDAGPVLQARVSELRAMRDSMPAVLDAAAAAAPDACGDAAQAEPYLVSNTDLKDFRMIVTEANPHSGKIALDDAELHLLRSHNGDTVRTLSLNPRKHTHV
jgi:arginine N-succinyltransferase